MAKDIYTDKELVEMALETNYMRSLKRYLSLAKSEEAKVQIQEIINSLLTYGELED